MKIISALKDVRLSRADLLPLMLGCLTEVNDKHSLNLFEARNLKVFKGFSQNCN